MMARRLLERKLEGATFLIMVALIVGFVVVLNRPRWEDQVIVSVEGGVRSSSLAVMVAHSRCPSGDPVVRVDTEAGERIVLRAEYDVSGDCDAVALLTTLSVTIDGPLADRSVLVEPANATLECSIAGRANGACTP